MFSPCVLQKRCTVGIWRDLRQMWSFTFIRGFIAPPLSLLGSPFVVSSIYNSSLLTFPFLPSLSSSSRICPPSRLSAAWGQSTRVKKLNSSSGMGRERERGCGRCTFLLMWQRSYFFYIVTEICWLESWALHNSCITFLSKKKKNKPHIETKSTVLTDLCSAVGPVVLEWESLAVGGGQKYCRQNNKQVSFNLPRLPCCAFLLQDKCLEREKETMERRNRNGAKVLGFTVRLATHLLLDPRGEIIKLNTHTLKRTAKMKLCWRRQPWRIWGARSL